MSDFPRLQVFISSNMRRRSMRKERAAVREILSELGVTTPWHWEAHGAAGPRPPMSECLDAVRESHVLVLLVGRRLNENPRKEHALAVELEIPDFIFAKKSQQDRSARRYIQRHKDRCTYREFGSVDELKYLLRYSVGKYITETYRAHHGMRPEMGTRQPTAYVTADRKPRPAGRDVSQEPIASSWRTRIRHERAEIAEFQGALKKKLERFAQAMQSKRFGDACNLLAEVVGDLLSAGAHYAVPSLDVVPAAMRRRLRATAPEAWAWFLCAVGIGHAERQEYSEAEECTREMLPIGRKLSGRHIESTALQNLGLIYFKSGNRQKAKQYYRRSLVMNEEVGDRHGVAQLKNNLAAMAAEDGRRAEAEMLAMESLQIKRRLRDRHGMIAAHGLLGSLAVDARDWKAARGHYRRALRAATSYGTAEELCAAYLNLGNVLLELGESEGALSHYREGLELAQTTSDLASEEMLRKALGVAYSKLGRDEEASQHFLALVDVERKLGRKYDEAMSYHDAAVTSARAGQAEAAVEFYRKAAHGFRRATSGDWEVRTLWEMAATLADMGEADACRSAINRSIRAAARVPSGEEIESEAYRAGVNILLSMGNLGWATALFRREQRFLRLRGDGKDLARRSWEVAKQLQERDAPRRAIPLLRGAARIYARMRENSLADLVRNDLACARTDAGQLKAARSEFEFLVRKARRGRNRAIELYGLLNLAEVARRLGDAERAIEQGARARSLAAALNDSESMAMLLSNMGLAYQQLGDAAKARSHFQRSVECARDSGNALAEARALNNHGDLRMRADEYAKALRYYERALARLRPDLTATADAIDIMINRLECLVQLGRDADASAAASEALDAAAGRKDWARVTAIAVQVAEENLKHGDTEPAAKALLVGLACCLAGGQQPVANAFRSWLFLLFPHKAVPYDAKAFREVLTARLRELSPDMADTVEDVVRKLDRRLSGSSKRPRPSKP